jgi:hypothetical protein
VDAKLLGDTYMVTLASGDVLSLPVSLVTGIEVLVEPPPAPPAEQAAPQGSGRPPDKPQVLSGPEVKPLTTSEQLRALGEPAEFAKPTFDPYWHPTSAFTELNTAEMKPTEWAEPIIDPVWRPQNGFTELNKADMKPTEWAKPSIDPHWQPTNAWGP